MKNITKLMNTANEKYWKQWTEIHFRPFAMTAPSELTRTWCVSSPIWFLIGNVIWFHFFYRQIVTVQANFVRLTDKIGLETDHRKLSHRYARVNLKKGMQRAGIWLDRYLEIFMLSLIIEIHLDPSKIFGDGCTRIVLWL